jgi:hypothetical protein
MLMNGHDASLNSPRKFPRASPSRLAPLRGVIARQAARQKEPDYSNVHANYWKCRSGITEYCAHPLEHAPNYARHSAAENGMRIASVRRSIKSNQMAVTAESH